MAAAPAVQKAAEVLRVRVRHAEPAGDGLRAWARTELPRTDLHPPALAPSAVLVVRRLDGGLPRTVTTPAAVRTPTRGWDRELRAELASLLARAARPHDGRLPPDPPAVVFADRAELVACLVADVLRGVAARRWWWEAPLREAGGADIAGLLGRHVELLPGVLDLLQRWDLAVAAVRRVDAVRAARLLDDLGRTFALDAPPRPGPAGPGAVPAPADATAAAGAGPGADNPQGGTWDGAAMAPPPWERWLGPSVVPGHLAPEPALLLATALLLHRSPGVARSPEVAAAIERARPRWPATQAHGDVAARPPGPAPVASPPPTLAATPVSPPAPEPDCGRSGARHPEPTRSRPAEPDTPVSGPPTTPEPLPPVGGPPTGRVAGGGRGRDRLSTAPPGAAAAALTGGPGPAPADQVAGTDQPAAAAAHLAPDAVHTRLAGLFYLVNLTDRLGLPDDVDRRWRVGELSGWALLEVLSRGLLDTAGDPDDRHDPLWRLLERLDGRPPGTAVGFDQADLDLAGGDLGDHELEEPVAGPLVGAVASGTRRWLRSVTPVVRRRLAAELGVDPAGAAAVLRVPGLVHHSRTHVDVVMDLEAISLPVRLAGLDRDPGWVPRLGRVVAFVFTPGGPA